VKLNVKDFLLWEEYVRVYWCYSETKKIITSGKPYFTKMLLKNENKMLQNQWLARTLYFWMLQGDLGDFLRYILYKEQCFTVFDVYDDMFNLWLGDKSSEKYNSPLEDMINKLD